MLSWWRFWDDEGRGSDLNAASSMRDDGKGLKRFDCGFEWELSDQIFGKTAWVGDLERSIRIEC
jgi:hypothetical protein